MICVIDDHPIMREAIAMVLRRLRPDMHIAELGRLRELQPLSRFPKPPSVIFMDLNLPDAVGWSGVFQVKTSFPKVPLAVYSASPAVDMEQCCLEAGADLYVEKSADTRELAVALDSLLPKTSAPQGIGGRPPGAFLGAGS